MSDLEYLKNKREEVLKAIEPICKPFKINFNYVINENNLTEILVLDNQKIGCSCNSISAIVEEVVGYIFVRVYDRWWYHKPQTINAIKKYWL